jgi:hypothetical protein
MTLIGSLFSLLYSVTFAPLLWLLTLPYNYPTLAYPLYFAGLFSIGAYLVIVLVS